MADPFVSPAIGSAETPADFGKGEAGEWAYWQTQEKIADKEERSWIRRSRKIVKRFRDERPDATNTGRETKKFSLLWSNVETLLPVFYGQTPKADVDRRFKDDDPVSRLAATLLERALNYSIDTADFDGVMKPAVKDRLLCGRGVARVLYIPHFGDKIPSGDESEEKGQAGSPASAIVANEGDETPEAVKTAAGVGEDKAPDREVVFEEAKCAYVFWEDYREGPARVWAEVPWVRYKSYLTRDELVARFGDKIGEMVTLDYSPAGADKEDRASAAPPDAYKKAVVHEYWNKAKLQAVWIAPGTPDVVLDKKPDPLKLNGFFPNPDPLLATTSTDKRIPVPDFIFYQDQATLIDDLTYRISKLIRALRAKGVYAADQKDSIQRLFDVEDDAVLIPVENWPRFAASGGLEKIIEWVPIQQIAETLIQLYEARDKELQVVYQITGISDILRGETQPEETMGAQRLKSNFASRRITPKQKDVADFARGLIRLQADLIATHFSAKTISMITGYPQLKPVPPMPQQPAAPPPAPTPQVPAGAPPGAGGLPGGQGAAPGQPPQPDPAMAAYQQQMAQYQQQVEQVQAVMADNAQKQQQFDQAVARLREDAMHDFLIDIEADSTIAPDEMAEKMGRVEFAQQMIPMMEQVIPIAQGNPPMAALAKEITMFVLRGFHIARSLEESFEAAFDAIAKMPPNENAAGGKKGAAGPDPKVEMAKVQQRAQADQSDTAAKAAAAQQANAIKATQVQGQLAIEQQNAQRETEVEAAHIQIAREKLQQTERFRAAEMVNMAHRDAEGLA